jgi:hypothetical protein
VRGVVAGLNEVHGRIVDEDGATWYFDRSPGDGLRRWDAVLFEPDDPTLKTVARISRAPEEAPCESTSAVP